jgi:hypothetical protein
MYPRVAAQHRRTPPLIEELDRCFADREGGIPWSDLRPKDNARQRRRHLLIFRQPT